MPMASLWHLNLRSGLHATTHNPHILSTSSEPSPGPFPNHHTARKAYKALDASLGRSVAMAMAAVYRRRMHASSVSTHRPTHAQAPASTMINILGVSHVFAHVRHLPRKLVCLFDPSSSSASAREQQVRPVSQISSPCDPDYVAHTTTSNLGRSGYDNVIDSGYAYECPSYGHLPSSSTCAVSALQSPTLWNPGPIISKEQLEAMLKRRSLVFEDAAADSASSPAASPNFSKSSINDSRISMPIPTRPSSSALLSAWDLADDSNLSLSASSPTPRGLTPPPEHFRRQGPKAKKSGAPFASPADSSRSPRTLRCDRSRRGSVTLHRAESELDAEPCRPRVALHEVLSGASLVATPLRLYTPGADDESKTNEGASVNAKLDAVFSNPDFDATPKPALDPAPASTATSRSRILSKRKRSFPVRRAPFNHMLSTSTR